MSSQRKNSIVIHKDRKRVIEKSLSGISVKDISSLLGIKYSTVWAIVKQFNTIENVISKRWEQKITTYQFAEKHSTIMGRSKQSLKTI